MTDTNLLKAKLIEKNYKQSEIASKLGVSLQTFSYKLHNKIEFKASEINELCKILNITDKDAYFFAN